MGTYWENRKNLIYFHAAELVCRRFSESPESVLDVGSNRTPTLEWHRANANRLVSIDLARPYRAEGIESIRSDFLQFQTDEKFDLVTCFQVLEHIPDPKPFAQKLMTLGSVLVISVPYKWPKGKCKWHPNDPVDEDKLYTWFGRHPNYSYLAKEVVSDRSERLIQAYLLDRPPPKKKWSDKRSFAAKSASNLDGNWAKKSSATKKRTPLPLRILRRLRREVGELLS